MRGDVAVLRNMKIKNSIVMTDVRIDYGKRITEIITGRKIKILSYEQNLL